MKCAKNTEQRTIFKKKKRKKMTDKEILDEVYRRLCFIDSNFKGMDNTLEIHSVRSFIEQEWQKQDDEEVTKWEGSHQTHPYGQFSNSWYGKDKKFKNRNDA